MTRKKKTSLNAAQELESYRKAGAEEYRIYQQESMTSRLCDLESRAQNILERALAFRDQIMVLPHNEDISPMKLIDRSLVMAILEELTERIDESENRWHR